MWCVLSLDGDVIESFPAGRRGWLRAIRFAEREGGELDVVFMASWPGWTRAWSGLRTEWRDED